MTPVGGGFKYFLFSPRNLGEDEPILTIIKFPIGLKTPTSNSLHLKMDGWKTF